jgi:S1-C subfamily serine protease
MRPLTERQKRRPTIVGLTRAARAAAVLGLLTAPIAGPLVAQQATGAGIQAGTARYKLLRTVSGARGSTESGRFVIEDPRTVFYVPGDTQIVFYFEWEGPPAPHRLEGIWTDPAGKLATISAFDYESKERRFGGQWLLPLGQGIATGTWTFEARVDGEAAGRHLFEIRAEARPESLPVASRALSPAEVYRQLQSAVVVVERLDATGDVSGTGLGFAYARDQVLTAFQVVDGAARVRLTFPDQRVVEARGLSSLDRWQNWAMLPAPTGSLPVLQRSPASKGWQVGDRVYSISLSEDRGLTIVDAAIMGTARPERSGERLTLTTGGGGRSEGAPVLNEYGDVIALLGDQTIPGESLLPRPMLGPSATERGAARAGVYAVPVNQAQPPAAGTGGLSFVQLEKEGEFTPALGAGRMHVVRATTAQGARKEPGWINPVDEKAVFARRSGSFTVILNLRPRAKLRLSANCRIVDLDGHKLGEGKPAAVKADVNDTPVYAWQVSMAQTQPGLYRVEIVFDGQPVWRTFVRITE